MSLAKRVETSHVVAEEVTVAILKGPVASLGIRKGLIGGEVVKRKLDQTLPLSSGVSERVLAARRLTPLSLV